MIRQAKLKDIDAIFELGQTFLDRQHGEGKVRVDDGPEGRKEMRYLMASKTGIVLIDRDEEGLHGFIIGQVCKQSFVKWKYVTDVAFVVRENKPITAVKLLRHFIHWGRQQRGVQEVLVNVTTGMGDPERMTRMYEKLGMRHVGGSFSLQVEPIQARKAA